MDGDRHLFDVRGRSAEQRVALYLLGDDGVGIVSLGGPAGTGKSVLALAAALDAVLASCAPGIAVVNIDNGYGAACAALRLLNAASRLAQEAER